MRIKFKFMNFLIFLGICLVTVSPGLNSQRTGAHSDNVWKVSSGLKYAYHQCYDVTAWNANGSRILLRGKKGTVYLVKGLEAEPETVKLPEVPAGYIQWDRMRPDIFYYVTQDPSHQTAVYSYNIISKENKLLFKAPGGLQLAPPHPDGEHLLLYPQQEGVGIAEIYSLQTQKVLIVPLPDKVYRVRFTKHPDLSIFCILEKSDAKDRTNWIMDAYTGVARQLVEGSTEYPDWQPGGILLSYFENGRLLMVNRKGEPVKIIPDIEGFQSWADDGKTLVIAVTYKKSKYFGEIVTYDSNSGEIRSLAKYFYQPLKAAQSLVNPYFSPDKTKVVFNSDESGKGNTQVYVVKVKSPEPVKNLRLNPGKTALELTWSATTAKEVKNIQVYKIYQDGKRVKQAELEARQTRCLVKYEDNLKSFEVVVREFSGLESEPATVEITRSGSWLSNLF